jgi:cell division transport system ATP-binding protein
MIEFQNVSVCYDPDARHPSRAVDNISLKVTPGEWVFLVGPSGAGKSTLLKLLHCSAAHNARVEGRIFVDKQDISHPSAHEIPFIRRKIGVIFQDFQLLAQKTAWENIAFALRVIGTSQSRIAREVPRALDIVGLAHRAHAQPHELSGGEQQRIAIARAIVNNPMILLADEPTGNLDPDTAAGIAEVLRRINEERGTTVLMATHDRHLVDSMKQRVVRIRDGKVASDEAHGIYHPEDDLPVVEQRRDAGQYEQQTQDSDHPVIIVTEPQVAELADAEAEADTASESESTFDTGHREEEKARYGEPPDAISRQALNNQAPLGSDENPIVQYGRR